MESITDSAGIQASVESLIGGRDENQDSYGMVETTMGLLVVVCDGMGGGPSGKLASTIATQQIIDYVTQAPLHISPISVLQDAAVAANDAILNEVNNNPTLKGMGTTCVALLIAKKNAYIMHVGDSRCYQLRNSRTIFRTSDHSYVGELVKRGTTTEEEARTSRYSNVITRALGVSPIVVPDVDEVSYRPNDRFALMSDGIWGALPEPELVRLLTQPMGPSLLVPAVTRRIDIIGKNDGGEHDNLTLAVIDISNGRTDHKASDIKSSEIKETLIEHTTPLRKSNNRGYLHKKSTTIIAIIIAIFIIALGFYLFSDNESSTTNEDINALTGMSDLKEQDETEPEPTITPHPEINNNTQDKEVSTYSNKKEELIKQVIDQSGNVSLQNVIDELNNLRNYNPKNIESFSKRKEERARIFDSAIKKLEKCIRHDDSPTDKKIIQLLVDMQKNVVKNKMIQIDSYQKISTKEANDEIDKYIARIRNTFNQ